ncbi:MAG TPA: RIP metalloprotease RseP [Firmicutes bacterium]|nr:MAG: RIP metalloprotease RseP [Candidatus Omnitrophota bacterium]HDD64555.1 RIP metalloprotease RseP [Bacillota bacterium]
MLISIISIIFLFSIIIFIHEFGHFWVAKKVGVRVEKFSIGFGPKLFSFKKGETTYQICLLPFGGFVKLAGEENTKKDKFEEWEYMGKSPLDRSKIIVSGSLHNLLFGFFILIFVYMLGIDGYDGTKIGSLLKGFPAEKSGLKVDDEVIRVNGERVREWYQVILNIRKSVSKDREKEIELEVKRNGKILKFKIKPAPYKEEGMEKPVYIIGIGPKIIIEKYSFPHAFLRASREFYKLIYSVFLSIKLLITKQVSPKFIAGPVGIAKWTAEIAHRGFTKFLYYLSFISINIGIINLFPFPVFDGGHLLGLMGEGILRRRPSRKMLEICQYIGIILLISLALYITYNDILRILGERIKGK